MPCAMPPWVWPWMISGLMARPTSSTPVCCRICQVPRSGSISTSQTWQPYGKLASFTVSSHTPVSAPRSSSGKSARSVIAAATSPSVIEPPPGLEKVMVAGKQPYLFDWDTEPLVEQLSEARLVPLSIRYGADDDVDAAIGVYSELCALARNAGCSIHVVSDANATIFAESPGRGLARRKPVPISKHQRLFHDIVIGAAVIDHPERICVRHLLLRHEIAAAQFDAIETELARGDIDQPLHHEHHFGPPGAAVGSRRRGVAHHAAGTEVRGRYAIDARHDLDALLDHRVVAGARAQITDVVTAHP